MVAFCSVAAGLIGKRIGPFVPSWLMSQDDYFFSVASVILRGVLL